MAFESGSIRNQVRLRQQKSPLQVAFAKVYGCRNRTRTYDPLINSQLLYQLSYAAVLSIGIYLIFGCSGRLAQ